MDIIPYEQFQIKEETIKRLTGFYVDRKVAEYFRKNGVLPTPDVVDTFVMPPEVMEEHRKNLYAKYYKQELDFEKKYGPGEMIEISFNLSTSDDNNSELLGGKSPLLFGSGENENDTEYQYGYWSIVVMDEKLNILKIGSFTSLENAIITLNSIKKYNIFVYYRRSNYLYDKIISYHPILNEFHDVFTKESGHYEIRMSDYFDYQTQMEDKEYIGVIKDYVPVFLLQLLVV